MSRLDYTVNVDEYLALNKYEVDEESAHIELAEDQDPAEFDKLIMVCPAALYKRDEDGNVSFDYAGCLECGTCRIICGDTIIKKWENPGPTMGVEYRFGSGPTAMLPRGLRIAKYAIRPISPSFGMDFGLGVEPS